MQVIDFVRPQESVLLRALPIHEREHDAGQLRVRRVQETVRGEMHIAILTKRGAGRGGAARIEVERRKTFGRGHERQNLCGLAARERETLYPRHLVRVRLRR